ncbi:unnamed protein product [Arabidopsis arenosa]|uniref:Uncharacterized protein n=1 Tax=Arabidopsis arenosa TaxID=38785 RepID=A0A8S1ZNV0_ARAAE|nr:unnamed protein product [Arabidopsis arenosa]
MVAGGFQRFAGVGEHVFASSPTSFLAPSAWMCFSGDGSYFYVSVLFSHRSTRHCSGGLMVNHVGWWCGWRCLVFRRSCDVSVVAGPMWLGRVLCSETNGESPLLFQRSCGGNSCGGTDVARSYFAHRLKRSWFSIDLGSSVAARVFFAVGVLHFGSLYLRGGGTC